MEISLNGNIITLKSGCDAVFSQWILNRSPEYGNFMRGLSNIFRTPLAFRVIEQNSRIESVNVGAKPGSNSVMMIDMTNNDGERMLSKTVVEDNGDQLWMDIVPLQRSYIAQRKRV